MHPISGILYNHVLYAALIGWFMAQALKIPIYYLVEGKWDWHRFHGSGGMPSSHTSMVVSASIMLGALNGFDSALFAAALVFSSVVMYDATGVRRETGRQAEIINQILQDVLINGRPISNVELKELIGHKPIEVAAGAILGILIASVYLLILF
ncbi:MAG: divergent PAP2 family protein [Clostridia bacterium]|nr:divergent PAP2 family protein [Clostridia bacterium]